MQQQSWWSKFIFYLNIVFTVATFVAYTLPFLAPKAFPFLSVLTLVLPFFLMVNFLFFLYWLLQLKHQMLLSGILLLLGISFLNRFYKFSETNLPEEPTDIKLMSYNVRLFNLYEWLPNDDVPFQISNLLLDEQPDILCLQDYSPNEDVNVNMFKYKTVKLEGDRLKFGQAIYSKFRIVNSGEIEFPNSYNSVIYADIVKDKDTLRVYSMHLESVKISADINQEMDEKRSKFIFNNISKAFSQQQNQSELIKEHYASCHYPKIICGDMNNSAFSYVYRTIKGDLKDAFEEAGTGFGKSYNYKYYPARIDYIFVENTIDVKQFTSLDYFIQSDHFPQLARLKINPTTNL